MFFSTDTVKKGVRPDSVKRRVILSNGIDPNRIVANPNQFRRVKRITPNAVPKDGFPAIQTADLRDIERRKRDAFVRAQAKAAGILKATKSAKQPVPAKRPVTPAPPIPAAATAQGKRKPGRPRKSETK